MWVRLATQAAYDDALAAHRDGRRVRAEGRLLTVEGHLELRPRTGTLTPID